MGYRVHPGPHQIRSLEPPEPRTIRAADTALFRGATIEIEKLTAKNRQQRRDIYRLDKIASRCLGLTP